MSRPNTVLGKRLLRDNYGDSLTDKVDAEKFKMGKMEITNLTVVVPTDILDRIVFVRRQYGYHPEIRWTPNGWFFTYLFTPKENETCESVFRKFFDGYSNSDSHRLKNFQGLEALKLLMSGLMPKRGRNDKDWVQVDDTTKKLQQVSGPESFIHLYFRKHELAEPQLLHMIVSFLK